MTDFLVYGSYGYTGDLVVREAVSRGDVPILAGRDADRLADQARRTGCESRAFSVDDPDLAARVADADVVLNCAGPFVETADPLAAACVDAGTDYLDVTGEFQVFERLTALDDRAAEAGATVLPGVGFDVVPSDCLGAFCHERLPSATHLSLAITGLTAVSRGTARTLVRGLGEGGVVRRDGRLVQVPMAHRSRQVDFGFDRGRETAVTVPLPDVSTAGRSTGVENVDVYTAVPSFAVPVMRAADSLDWVLGSSPVQRGLDRLVDLTTTGPDDRHRRHNRGYVWAEAVADGDAGPPTAAGVDRVVARMRTPDPYALTAETAVTAAERVRDGDVEPGYQTPSTAFGADFALQFDGVEREVVEAPDSTA